MKANNYPSWALEINFPYWGKNQTRYAKNINGCTRSQQLPPIIMET